VRGPRSAPVESEYELFGFLTTEANASVAPIRPKVMPVILTSPDEVDSRRRRPTLWRCGGGSVSDGGVLV
jgi:hypothetical protein